MKIKLALIKKYHCSIYGYIYDLVKGDVDGGIKTEMAFEDLPED